LKSGNQNRGNRDDSCDDNGNETGDLNSAFVGKGLHRTLKRRIFN
jgi:hypothetical protein